MSELDDVQTTVGVIDGLRARIAELETAIERLKVCGTCGLYLEKGVTGTDEYPWCDADDDELVACGTNDSCHFTPPRWKPYWKEER